jgi:Flp pilus assembly protein TadG
MRIPNAKRQQGAVLVEFALVVTILLVLMAGMFEFGRAFWYYEALTKATRDAARSFSVASKATIKTQGMSNAKTVVANAATAAGLPNFSTTNVTVTCLDSSYADSSCNDGTAPGGVRVEITGYTIDIGGMMPLIGSAVRTLTLAPSTTMRYMF